MELVVKSRPIPALRATPANCQAQIQAGGWRPHSVVPIRSRVAGSAQMTADRSVGGSGPAFTGSVGMTGALPPGPTSGSLSTPSPSDLRRARHCFQKYSKMQENSPMNMTKDMVHGCKAHGKWARVQHGSCGPPPPAQLVTRREPCGMRASWSRLEQHGEGRGRAVVTSAPTRRRSRAGTASGPPRT